MKCIKSCRKCLQSSFKMCDADQVAPHCKINGWLLDSNRCETCADYKEKVVSKDKLLEYVKRNEIAFQYIDGLIHISHPNTNKYDEDYIREEVEWMYLSIKESKTLKVVLWDEVIQYGKSDYPFMDLAEWVLYEDLLILVDSELLLCLPDTSTYNEVLSD